MGHSHNAIAPALPLWTSLSHFCVLTLVFQIRSASSMEEHLLMNQTLQKSDSNNDLWMLPWYNYIYMNSWKDMGKCSGQNTVKPTPFLDFFDHFKQSYYLEYKTITFSVTGQNTSCCCVFAYFFFFLVWKKEEV